MGRFDGKGSRKHDVRPKLEQDRVEVTISPKDLDERDSLDEVQIEHQHPFRVVRDIFPDKVKETIVLDEFPEFDGPVFEVRGRIRTKRDLAYNELHVFDSDNAIDHFAEMVLHRNKEWCIRVRRVWLEGRAYPVFIDPTLSVAGNDIALFRRTTTCFPAYERVVMEDGSAKAIYDVRLGDRVRGGEVYGVMQFHGCRLYSYRGILVSPDHLVRHEGRWMRVVKAGGSLSSVMTTVNFLLQTDSGRVWMRAPDGQDVEFSAFEGAPGDRTVEDVYEREVIAYLERADG